MTFVVGTTFLFRNSGLAGFSYCEMRFTQQFLVFIFPDILMSSPSGSYDSIWTSWRYTYPDCANAKYEYELYRGNGGPLVKSGANSTTYNGFRLSGLPCDTTYRLRVRYRTSTKTIEDKWFSTQTRLPSK